MIFKCKNCGGNVVYAPEKEKMICENCESEESQDILAQKSMSECANCGAPLELQTYTSATKCVHCGSYVVLDDKITGEYEPHLVIPFLIGKKEAAELLRKEFSHRLFLPGDFLSEKTLEKLLGIYVPFFLYDYFSKVDYQGVGTKIRTWQSGNVQYTETNKYDVRREIEINYEKIPVDASIAMTDEIMDLMEPYNYGKMADYQPKYMAGFYGEFYNEGAEVLEQRAKRRAEEYSEEWLKDSISGYNAVIPSQKSIDCNETGVNYALLPVWNYVYRYKGKDYSFYLNGETGKIVGKAPVCWKKAAILGAFAFIISFGMLEAIIRLLEVL